MKSKEIIEQIFAKADIKIGGSRPWDVDVHDSRFYNRVLADGTLGAGETYMDGWWNAEELDKTVFRFLHSGGQKLISNTLGNAIQLMKSKFLNLQTKTRSQKVVREHYNLGNDLYMAFLDPYNQYTCGYFKDTNDLNTAQEQKLDLICKKLQLRSSDRVLDIGCGWGGFTKWASEHYGCHVTGVSISDEQIKYAKNFTKGLPVEIVKMDYRDISGKYDKVLICGMIEHVGYKNYRTIMKKVKEIISSNGLFILHCIGRNDSTTISEPWMEKYIFPNSMLPSVNQIAGASEGLFIMEDWHNFGAYYDSTLMSWWNNFEVIWPRFEKQYGTRFYRMFRYYLLSCAGAFRARDIQLWQVVLSPNGNTTGYESMR